jgi:hypothetical protein
MKIYSRFKGTDLSHSMLANFVMPQCRDRGAMAAMGRRRPPWSGVDFPLASAYIRSNTMSHITFKMRQFVLIIYLREYHYDFDLDIVVE